MIRPLFRLVLAAMALVLLGSVVSPLSAEQDALQRHLDNLERALDQRVAESVAGRFEPRAWHNLRRQYLRVNAGLESGSEPSRRAIQALRHLGELEALAGDPEALGAHFRRLRSEPARSADGKVANGTVSGRITSSLDGSPLAYAEAHFSNEEHFQIASTDENGFYSLTLPAGVYSVAAFAGDYQSELYDDHPCSDVCSYPEGDPVEVPASGSVTGIDFTLESKGRVLGRVVAESSGIPLAEVVVEAWEPSGLFSVGSALTATDGTYEMGGLESGDYWIVASGAEYQTEAYDDVPCGSILVGQGCPGGGVQVVSVDLNQNATGVDFALARRGSITGRITDAASGQGLEFVEVWFESVQGGLGGVAYTDAQGMYQSPGFDEGEFWVRTENYEFYVNELYPNVPCGRSYFSSTCDYDQGIPVQVNINATTRNIDFALDQGGTISGTVSQAVDGSPIEFVQVSVFGSGDQEFLDIMADANGNYEAKGLKAGPFTVVTASLEHENQLYDNKPCGQFGCPVEEADLVDVELGQVSSGVDFVLNRLGVITGRVVDKETRQPISSGLAFLFSDDVQYVNTVDEQGVFEFSRLSAGAYRLFAQDLDEHYLGALYPDIPCASTDCDPNSGELIEVELNSVTDGLEIGLGRAGAIQGVARDRATGLPVTLGEISVYDVNGDFVTAAYPGLDGSYSVRGLTSGDYFADFYDYLFGRHIFGGGFCDLTEPCDPLTGTSITVVEGSDVAGIDFEIDFLGCRYVDEELCVRNGRFRVMAQWRDPSGNEGLGQFVWLSNDSGYFWFFDQENIEGVVKVLDACSPAFDRYWVFAAGLTDLDVTLWVVDSLQQATRVYSNTGGRAFQPIQDTDAFDTCPDGLTAQAPTSELRLRQERFEAPVSAAAKACDTASGRLCLNDGRFSLEAFYQAPGQAEQLAGAFFLTNDSGYFYFFTPENVEILVKVLDACTVFDRFWVFGAGLTDVQVRLVVTDTESGEVQEYVNGQGNAFVPIQDTQAFATCF